jgi:hypothetical protein
MDDYKNLHNYLKERFPNAQFSISCFQTKEEVDTKILCDDDEIIYCDEYTVHNKRNNKWVLDEKYNDFFIIKKREGEKHIYYKDVIDDIIKHKFTRNDSDHCYLENIKPCFHKRNQNSVPIYSSFWGS